MVIKSKISRSLMGRFQREPKSNTTRWSDVLDLYRTSKLVAKLIDKFSLQGLSELTGFSISYISGVEGFWNKPNEEFLEKLEQLNES